MANAISRTYQKARGKTCSHSQMMKPIAYHQRDVHAPRFDEVRRVLGLALAERRRRDASETSSTETTGEEGNPLDCQFDDRWAGRHEQGCISTLSTITLASSPLPKQNDNHKCLGVSNYVLRMFKSVMPCRIRLWPGTILPFPQSATRGRPTRKHSFDSALLALR